MEDHPSLMVHVEIDTARPFRSVREAVAVFSERLQPANVYIQKPPTTPKHETPPPPLKCYTFSSSTLTQLNQEEEEDCADLVKRLEAELEEMKRELRQLKARELETEITLASLNAELHRNMSRMAEAEAAEAARCSANSRLLAGGIELDDGGDREKKMEFETMRLERSPSLAQILSIGEKKGNFGMTRKVMKKKPIVPLIGDMFPRKKSSFSLFNPLHGRSYAC